MSETGMNLEKRHGVKDVVVSNVGVLSVVGMFYAICCAGAFGIEEMIPECGPGLTIVMLLVLPVAWALPYSLLCAEMGSARPVEGGNLMWILAVPVLYVLAKWRYKGSTIEDPDAYPINPKTRLGFGDVKKIGLLYAGIGVFAVFAWFFLDWYEGDWGPEYYLEEYESGIFANFDGMLNVILVIGIVCLAGGLILWLVGRKTD